MLAIRFIALCETGQDNEEKVENTRGEGWEWSVFIFKALKVVVPACVDWGPIVWTRWTRLIMYWRIRNLWGPTNLVASMVAELDDTPLYFTDDTGIVFRPSTDYSSRFHVEDDTRVRWAQLDSLILITKGGHSCCFRGSRVSCFQVVTLQSYIYSNLRDPLGYRWCLFAAVIP
jgi:hypothetical protein